MLENSVVCNFIFLVIGRELWTPIERDVEKKAVIVSAFDYKG